MRTSQSADFHQTLGEALDGPAATDVLDADLKKEILFAASRGPEALEGLLACLDPAERHAAFGFLQSEEGNNKTARALGRKSPEEENFLARRAALDAEPVQQSVQQLKEVAQVVTERAEAEAKAEAEKPAPPVAEEAPVASVASMSEQVTALSEETKEDRDNVLAREAHFAKKWEGNEFLARALARRRGGGGGST
jgi:hypothetical protein